MQKNTEAVAALTRTSRKEPTVPVVKKMGNWTKLDVEGVEVFYKEVSKTETDGLKEVSVISGDTINVSGAITVSDVQAVASAADGLTFTAYAIQKDGTDTPVNAWVKLFGNPEFEAADGEETNVLENED